MNDTPKNRKQHPLYFFIKEYPWLGEIRHDFSDFNKYLEVLNKEFNQSLYRQIVANVRFSCELLEKYENNYLKSIPVAPQGSGIINKFIFQISNNLLMDVGFGVEPKTEKWLIIPEFHSTALGRVVDFIDENREFLVEEPEEKGLGFGGV